MQAFWQELRHGTRSLLKKPGFTLVAMITLALGIGVNTAMFTIVNGMLLRPMPFKDPERLVHLDERSPQNGLETMAFSYPDFTDLRTRSRSYEQVAMYEESSYTLAENGNASRAERIDSANVTADLFPLLGVNAIEGRHFRAEEDKPGAAAAVIIGYRLWQRRFGGAPGVIGREVRIDGGPATIVGVMPAGFEFPVKAEIWRPLALALDERDRGRHFAYAIGRLKPGVTIETARAELQAIAGAIAKEHPQTNNNVEGVIKPWREALLEDTGQLLYLLLGVVGFVLLIACANVANLLLARGAARAGEVAIRAALGASRWRIMRQMLTESLLLAVSGGLLGLLLALWGADALMKLFPDTLPSWARFTVDWRVISFTFGATMVTALICGIAPGWQSSKVDLLSALNDVSRGNVGGRQRLRSLLVIGEVALAMMLLIGAGLMMKSFLHIRQIKTGFITDRVMTAKVALPESQYGDAARRNNFYQRLLDQLAVAPGIESVALTSSLPLSEEISGTGFYIDGQPDPADISQIPIALLSIVSPHYFQTMGMRLNKGRDFTDADREGQQKVAIIDETTMRRFFPNEDPIGKRLSLGGKKNNGPWFTIIGVVNEVRHWGLKKDARMAIYLPYQQRSEGQMTIVARSAGAPALAAAALRTEVAALDKELPIYAVLPMAEVVAKAMWDDKYASMLFVAFAALALVLASVGIYGVISYAVTQRVGEIGIRMALGAQTRDVLLLIMRQGMSLILLGVGIGLTASFALTRLMKSLLFGVGTTDLLTFVVVPILLTAVAALACYLPARRAMKINPITALRSN